MLTDRPATAWAWTQVESPNLDFGDTTLTFLALAELADRALLTPGGYSFTTPNEIAFLTRQNPGDVARHLGALDLCGLVVKCSIGGAYRVPEEAFGNVATCHACDFGVPVFSVLYRMAVKPVRVCAPCAARGVEKGEIVTLAPIEASGPVQVPREALAKGGHA